MTLSLMPAGKCQQNNANKTSKNKRSNDLSLNTVVELNRIYGGQNRRIIKGSANRSPSRILPLKPEGTSAGANGNTEARLFPQEVMKLTSSIFDDCAAQVVAIDGCVREFEDVWPRAAEEMVKKSIELVSNKELYMATCLDGLLD
uniref:Uncharacterized protein n=1 Tax=Odontella aurita TaxID=265563 RepID=A0A7S4HU25_9STRA|mmetsp:Transcript_15232/g.44195  ORF Transcript_15232/g.44195 Transcript_15232/m.44195 type:complete len:145 (+) Transcript_15232:129-563(+)